MEIITDILTVFWSFLVNIIDTAARWWFYTAIIAGLQLVGIALVMGFQNLRRR